jgi:hypothetical protein
MCQHGGSVFQDPCTEVDLGTVGNEGMLGSMIILLSAYADGSDPRLTPRMHASVHITPYILG